MRYYRMLFDQLGVQNITPLGVLSDEEYEAELERKDDDLSTMGEFAWIVDREELVTMKELIDDVFEKEEQDG